MKIKQRLVRDCANCQHARLCKVYGGVLAAVTGVGFLNIDGPISRTLNSAGPVTPGKVGDIFIALALACSEWKSDNE